MFIMFTIRIANAMIAFVTTADSSFGMTLNRLKKFYSRGFNKSNATAVVQNQQLNHLPPTNLRNLIHLASFSPVNITGFLIKPPGNYIII